MTMRIKILIISVLLIAGTINTFAQRLNKQGLKMISEIQYTEHNGNQYLLKFKYDVDNNLCRMTIIRNKKMYRDFIKTSDGLTAKDYDEYNYSPLRWEASFDCYGNISKMYVYDEFERGSIKRDEYNFFYERDENDNTFRLSSFDHTETSKRSGQKSWYGTTIGRTLRKLYQSDDAYLIRENNREFLKCRIDFNYINDTNMGLLSIINHPCEMFSYTAMDFISITEWLNCRNKYFIKPYNEESAIKIKYVYNYDDQRNLNCIEYWDCMGLETKIEIKYCY